MSCIRKLYVKTSPPRILTVNPNHSHNYCHHQCLGKRYEAQGVMKQRKRGRGKRETVREDETASKKMGAFITIQLKLIFSYDF